MEFTRWVVASNCGTSSSRSSFRLVRPTGVEMLIAATVRRVESRIGAATARRPISSSWSLRAQPRLATFSSSLKMSLSRCSVNFVSATNGRFPRSRRCSATGIAASSTRPVDVQYAGSRLPTESDSVMMRDAATRLTKTMSDPSSTETETDSRTLSLRSWTKGSTMSRNGSDVRNEYPISRIRGCRKNSRPSTPT